MLEVKIGDLGGGMTHLISINLAYQDSHPYQLYGIHSINRRSVTPRALRAPELINGDTWDASIDIWSLGCLVR